VNTPTPGNVAGLGDTSLLFRASLAPVSTYSQINSVGYDSSNDTEPEEVRGGLHTAFTSFNSYRTANTSPAISEQNLTHLGSPNEPSHGPEIRRTISADRLTMRPFSPLSPPPLLRTRSDGPSLVVLPSANTPNDSTTPSYSISPTIPMPAPPQVTKLADANSVLNAFCGQQIYSNLYVSASILV
jgi:hypothetical protein